MLVEISGAGSFTWRPRRIHKKCMENVEWEYRKLKKRDGEHTPKRKFYK